MLLLRYVVLICVLALAVPAIAPTADCTSMQDKQTVTTRQATQEQLKLYQLREFCNESNALEKRLDFAIQKLRDRRFYWNNKMVPRGSTTSNPTPVTTNFSKDLESQTGGLEDWRTRQVQNLKDRNYRYLEKTFDDVAKHGAEDPSTWAAVQAKHDELAQTIGSGDFQSCMAELDDVLPTRVKKGGRE